MITSFPSSGGRPAGSGVVSLEAAWQLLDTAHRIRLRLERGRKRGGESRCCIHPPQLCISVSLANVTATAPLMMMEVSVFLGATITGNRPLIIKQREIAAVVMSVGKDGGFRIVHVCGGLGLRCDQRTGPSTGGWCPKAIVAVVNAKGRSGEEGGRRRGHFVLRGRGDVDRWTL